jgi:hypothetical protein
MAGQDEFDWEEQQADPEHASLLDPEKTREVTEDAIVAAEYLTDDHRKIEMLQAIRQAAERHAYLTADQVWDCLGQVAAGRDDGSGLGPMMRVAAASGLIKNTRTFRRSERPPTHGRPLPVWQSLIKG